MSEGVTLEQCACFMEFTINDLWDCVQSLEEALEPKDPIRLGAELGELKRDLLESIGEMQEFYDEHLRKHRHG